MERRANVRERIVCVDGMMDVKFAYVRTPCSRRENIEMESRWKAIFTFRFGVQK